MRETGKRHIAILGSTGSIGTQALDVISQHPEMFQVELLTANNNSSLLIEQAVRFQPNSVVICNDSKYEEVSKALEPHMIKVFTGIDSICELVKSESIDIVLTAMVGFSGLQPTVSAIKAGKAIALANKETLVAAGEFIINLAKEFDSPIIPVDSEHSAIFQCLQGEHTKPEKLLLTGSGGPFLNTPEDELKNVTKAMALNHPRWKMGAKVTIDSSSLMNKGLELIEARWLFNMEPKDIDIVIHPQSIIHSMVQFHDGSVIAQLGNPDMRVPIQYALAYPYRITLNTKRMNFAELAQMTFFEPDMDKFPCLKIAYQSLETGGTATCIMNAANEVAVRYFLEEKIKFNNIPDVILGTLDKCTISNGKDLQTILEADKEASRIASEIVKAYVI